MIKMIGLARPLKIEWMNKTVDMILEGKSTDTIKSELNEYLSFEIDSPTSRRKTRESLMNIWVAEPEGYDNIKNNIKKMALSMYPALMLEKLPLHWCMMLVKYPIFLDICSLIGKMASIEEFFTTAWIKEKLFGLWGERTSLEVPVKNILRTFINFGTLAKVKTGVYKTNMQAITDKRTVQLFIITLLSLGKKSYYEVTELSKATVFFPFEYSITLELLHNIPEINLSNFGGKLVASVKE